MKPKVLHIFSGYGGGISSLILNLIDNSYLRIDYTLLCFSYQGGESFVKHMNSIGIECKIMPRLRQKGPFRLIAYINRVMKEGNFDVVHCHIDGKALLLFGLLAKKNGIRSIIVHAHKTEYEKSFDNSIIGHWFNKKMNYLLTTNYMSCSNMAASFLFGTKYLKKRPTIHIPNGIDADKFSALINDKQHLSKLRDEFSFLDQDIVLLNVGRFSIQKNHIFMIDLIKRLLEISPHFKLLLVGTGELQNQIESYICSCGVENNVLLAGRRQDIPQIMNIANLFILPSLWEGLPTVAIEAQAVGIPIILADTITQQCDMGLGLATFIPLRIDVWVDTILKSVSQQHKDVFECIDRIERNGYTSVSAGKLYADSIYQINVANKS